MGTLSPIDSCIKILVEEGPWGLSKWARREFGFEPHPEGYAEKDHLCVDVSKFLVETRENFPELPPLEFYQNLRSHLAPLEVIHEN